MIDARRDSIDRLTTLLKQGREQHPSSAWLVPTTEQSLIGGLVATISANLLADRHDHIPELVPQRSSSPSPPTSAPPR